MSSIDLTVAGTVTLALASSTNTIALTQASNTIALTSAGSIDLTVADSNTLTLTSATNTISLTQAENTIALTAMQWDAQLSDIAGLAVTNSNFIVGDGTNWVAESGNTARTSLGLGTGDSPTFAGASLGDGTNQTVISATGSMSFEGTGRFWQGVFVDVSRFKEPPANSATLVNRGIGTAYSFTKNQDDEHLHVQISIPGFWDVAEDLQVILHWDSPAISGDCYWEVRYQLFAEGGVMDSTTLDGTEGDVFTSSGTSKGLVHSTISIPTADFDTGDKKLRFALYRMGDNAGDTLEDFIYLHGIRVRGVRNKTGGAVT